MTIHLPWMVKPKPIWIFSVLFDTENRQDVLDDCIDQDLIQEEEDQQGTPYGRGGQPMAFSRSGY